MKGQPPPAVAFSTLHRSWGKLSYLAYPDFEADPHPALRRCVRAPPAILATSAADRYNRRHSRRPGAQGVHDLPLLVRRDS
jgi:hypothetical protein